MSPVSSEPPRVSLPMFSKGFNTSFLAHGIIFREFGGCMVFGPELPVLAPPKLHGAVLSYPRVAFHRDSFSLGFSHLAAKRLLVFFWSGCAWQGAPIQRRDCPHA
eukprot:3122360-Amphidinium_carterae.1